MKIRITLLISLILCFSFIGYGQERKIKKCVVPKSIGGKYKLLFEAITLSKDRTAVVDVVIKPKNFAKRYMAEFAKRIKAEYCNEVIVSASIFDNEESAQGWHYDLVISKGKTDRRRGTYFLDRKAGEEGVEFSTKPGNPINEVRIELSKPDKES